MRTAVVKQSTKVNRARLGCSMIHAILLSFSLTWDHMGAKITNYISPKSTHQIHCQKVMHIPTVGIYQSCSKYCEISNFGFLPFFSFSLKYMVRL